MAMQNGMAKHPLRQVYYQMIYRCYVPSNKSYHRYGGRGITVCEEWRSDPNAFWTWALTHGWRKGLYLDRADNNGNYCPENCRFVTAKESAANKEIKGRSVLSVEDRAEILRLKEEGVPLSKIAKRFKVTRPTIYAILEKFNQ